MRPILVATFACLCTCLSAGACAPDPSPPHGAERDVARALCEAECAHAIRCAGPRGALCGCGGVADRDLLREDWTTATIACLGRTSCSVTDAEDDCEAEAFRAIGAAPVAWPGVVMRCLQRGAACGGSSARCRRIAAMADGARAEVDACFDLPCDAYDLCLRGFLASRVTPAVPRWQ